MNLKFLFLFLAGVLPIQGADWLQFRGPESSGFSAESNVPSTLQLQGSSNWKTELPGRGLSSPIIVGERVFVSCSSGLKQQRLHLICLNARDGSRLWERQFWATGRTMCHDKTSVAAPTPASDGKSVVAIFSSSDVACLDLE
ncbi:MAG TPA: PQQ-binding-like beta-propeller repeat protein, partial [Candidatus Saccharimonadales bacterium]|nr:PQQ-binding-like beta-propeller repeat protein [Candidatus Saccharimonadales bacterium]